MSGCLRLSPVRRLDSEPSEPYSTRCDGFSSRTTPGCAGVDDGVGVGFKPEIQFFVLKATVHDLDCLGVDHVPRSPPRFGLHKFKGDDPTIDNLFVFGCVMDAVG